MGIGTPSGSWSWNPPLAEYVVEALERVQIYGPAIEDRHIIGLRRSMNFILSDYGNRGINLWTVDQINLPLIPGQATYPIPVNTVDVLDTYLRNYSFDGVVTLGHGLAPAHTATFDPVLQATGEPVVVGPSSGTFSTVAGSQVATMFSPNHGLSMGSAVMPQTPLMIGPMTLWGLIVVSSVIDESNFEFLLPSPALVTRTGVGGTPLFVTKSGSSVVTVVLPGHGLSIGASFPIQVPTAVGGLIMSGNFTVQSLPNPAYDFTIVAPQPATSNALSFESSGQINIALPAAGASLSTDLILTPISRDDYAALPLKSQPGRPTTFWFDRVITPTITVWPVPQPGSNYGFIAYRTRRIMDANPASGETLDVPPRFYNAFVAELTAAVSEKYRPELFAQKAALALAAWDRASSEDREKITSSIVPNFSGFFR